KAAPQIIRHMPYCRHCGLGGHSFPPVLMGSLSHQDRTVRFSYRLLGIDDVEPDILGRAYEYLLRKFAEGQGQSAGEFYTPREVAILMARLLEPEPGQTIYDAC